MDLSLKPCTTTTTSTLQDVRCNRNDSLLVDRLTSLHDELKPCTTTTTTTLRDVRFNCSDRQLVDRLTSLPDELLIRILSLLPTKDVDATCLLSKRMRCIFPWIESLDFDDSPISHCLDRPYGIERFPTFIAFVDNVLSAYQSQYLSRFRLGVGEDFMATSCPGCKFNGPGEKGCYPDLKSTQINAWISFPLTRFGLRELDLCIQVKEPGASELPPEIFTCEMLEVLKLDVNLSLDRTSTMSSFHLPNLKLLQLRVAFISEEGFVTRLVSSCPVLEDLMVEVYWNHYSIPNMDCLVKAHVYLENYLLEEEFEVSRVQMLTLIRPLSNVQHLTLSGTCIEVLSNVEVKDQLPVFHNLNCLELNHSCNHWDKLVPAFLNCSPVLETLVFPTGFVSCTVNIYSDYNWDTRLLVREFWRTTLSIIPPCCRYHLKTIVKKFFYGTEREIGLIQFLLRHALVLEELVIFRGEFAIPDRMALESTLQNLPRASVPCSIQVLERA